MQQLQNELRARLGLPSGIGFSRGISNQLRIECSNVEERDQVFSSFPKLCPNAIAMGYTHLLVSVLGTKLRHPFKLSILLNIDEELRSQHTGK